MDAKLISKILAELDEEISSQIMLAGLNFSEETITGFLPEFKNIICQYKKSSKQSPFAEKMIELYCCFHSRKRKILYAAFAKIAPHETISRIALEFFPHELLLHFQTRLSKFRSKH